ncbi:hypothetical protein [Rhizobium sp. RU36D]|uniref:hypothetical protein n=1 Tax=Rhizobium sp. RU36D TaxID=1907415 RepID=UPI0009D8EB20|nr:hypothetical protein [Rhizobium sp. RU36D]SMC61737.1 hypothetical protein SAMN05880593_103259 [Rhizobium sp. RU36D]
MEHDVAIWHYIAGIGMFCCLGALAHVCRALFNPVNDRSPDFSTLEMALDDDLPGEQGPLRTDYDASGHYRLTSMRNLRNAVALSALSGLCVMLASPDVAAVMAKVVDTGLGSMDNILAFRIETASWS